MADTKGLHEQLCALKEEIYENAAAITDLDDGKFYLTAKDRAAVRGWAAMILKAADEYDALDQQPHPKDS